MGTVPVPRQRRSVHLELDRQWGRWGYMALHRAVLSFQRGEHVGRNSDTGDEGLCSRRYVTLVILYLCNLLQKVSSSALKEEVRPPRWLAAPAPPSCAPS